MKSKMSFLLILFLFVELVVYFSINKLIESTIEDDIKSHKISFEEKINSLMNYKNEITTGDLGGYGPGEHSIDLEWFEDSNWLQYPDSSRMDKYVRDFLLAYSESYNLLYDLGRYDEIKKMESIYLIILPTSVWSVSHLYKSRDYFEVKNMRPTAWGYKKCNSFEKQFRPTGYEACKDAFEYITKESKYAHSFTDKSASIDAILDLENKYYYIARRESDIEPTYFPRIVYNNYYTVFYTSSVTSSYEIKRKNSFIKKEILDNTLIYFSFVSIGILLVFCIIGYVIFPKEKLVKLDNNVLNNNE